MLLALIELLRNFGCKVPAVFEYFSTRMVFASITSLLLTIFFGKRFIRKLYEWKIGDKVRSDDCPLLGELHRDKNDTPTMGGILILFSCLVSLFLWMDLRSPFTLLLLFVTLSTGMLGIIDDYLKFKSKTPKGLSGKKKLMVQFCISSLIALYLLTPWVSSGVCQGSWFVPPVAKEPREVKELAIMTTKEYASSLYVPCVKKPLFHATGLSLLLMGLFITLVITGSSNAVNLTDGLDGLATGTVMLASVAFALIAFISNHLDLSRYLNILYIEGAGEIAIYLCAIAGACLGFLWYNGHPAQVFMGDTGSLSLGAILGVSAVLLKRELLLAIIGGVFVVEALSVIMQVISYKFFGKKRIFLCSPLHHHFEYKGWPESKVVLRFWIVGLLLAIVGIATLKFQ